MTSVIINDILPRTQLVATGGQTIYSTTWTANAASDVVVYSRAAGVAPNDVTQVLSTSAYSVAFIGGSATVQVTLVTPSTAGDIVTIVRNTPADRENLYTNTNFTPSMLNNDFGIFTLVDQQAQLVNAQIGPRYNYSALINQVVDTILPVLPASYSWRKNSGNTAIETFQALDVTALNGVKFIVQQATAVVPSAQSLGNLTTGILKNSSNVGIGVLSISTPLTSLDNQLILSQTMPYGIGTNTYGVTGFTTLAQTLVEQATVAQMQAILELTPGGDVQPYSVALTSIANLTTSADEMIYLTGASVYATTPLTALARTLVADSTAVSMRSTLGLVIGMNVEAWSAALDSIAGLVTSSNQILYTTASNTYTTSSISALARTLIADTSTSTMQSTLGLVIGTNVEAWSASLDSIGPVASSGGLIAYTTAVNTWAGAAITSLGRDIIASPNIAAAAVTLGVVPLLGATMTGPLLLSADPTVSSQAATKAYVDAATAQSLPAAVCLTDSDMPTWVYNNGTLGVGATLTAPSNGVSTFDGITPSNGNIVFVLFQTTNPAWQGPYTIVQGTLGTKTVLTRSTSFNHASQMVPGASITVVSGTTWGASQWVFSQVNAITVGTTALTFSQLAGQGALLKANNLSDLTNVVSAQTNLLLLPGTNVQVWDATLTSIALLGTAANKIAYTTGVDIWAETDFTAIARTLNANTTNTGMRSTLGLVIGTNVEAWNATLDAVAAGTYTGSASITTLGTIATGIWQSTSIGSTYGGTGVSNPTAHGIMIAEGASAMTPIVLAAGQILIGTTASDPIATAINSGTNILVANASGSITVGFTGVLPIASGGTNVTSVTIAPTATAFAGWDANSNLSSSNFLPGYTTTATGGTTTTLTVASTYNQYFTGSTTQTVKLPVTSTLVLGQPFYIVNNSSGIVTIVSSGTNTVQAMSAGTTAIVTCILTSGTSAASWAVDYNLNSLLSLPLPIASGGTAATTAAGAVTNLGLGTPTGTGNVVLATSPTLITPNLGVATATSIVFSPTTSGIIGTTTNDNAAAGKVGEFISSLIVSGSPVSITNNNPTNLTSISLTAGDWDVWGNIWFLDSGTISQAIVWISSTSATIPDNSILSGYSGPSTVAHYGIPAPQLRFSLSGPTTVYISGYIVITSGTYAMCGGIYARRAR